MPQRDRVSIDLTGLIESINQCRNDATWNELSLTKRVKVLLIERLNKLESETNKDHAR